MKKPIREALDESGLTRKYISQKLGKSERWFYRMYHDPSNLKVMDAVKLGNLIGYNIYELDFTTPDWDKQPELQRKSNTDTND